MGYLIFLIIFGLFSISPPSVHAFSLGDIFHPPIQMEPSERRPPGEASAPEVKSDDSFSNLNTNSEVCSWEDLLKNTWEPDPPEEQSTTNHLGQKIINLIWPPTAAKNLEKDYNLSSGSNNYTRNTHDFAARGQIQCGDELERREFLSYGPGGDSAGNRSSNSRLAKWGRGQRYVDAILSLDPSQDVMGMDEHILYACGDQCRELVLGSAAGCRPVTIGEVAYFYYLNGIKKVYDDPVSFKAIDFPTNKEFDNYPANYQKRFGQPLVLLEKPFYDRIDRQLSPLSSGPVNQVVKVIRYGDYITDQHKILPSPTIVHRNIPQAAAGATKQTAKVWGQYTPASRQELDPSDPCNSVRVNGPMAIDSPPPISVLEFILGVLHWFTGPTNWANNPLEPNPHDSNEIYAYTEKQIVDNNHNYFEPFMADMIPQKGHEEAGFKQEPQNSKVEANYPIDVGYRSDKMYANAENGGKYSFAAYMQPQSWQVASEFTQPRPNTNPPTQYTGPTNIAGDVSAHCTLINKYAKAAALEPALIAALITVESGGNPSAHSACGASGLMQVMPKDADKYWSGSCAGAFNPEIFKNRPSFQELQDPEANIKYGTNLLKGMVNYWGKGKTDPLREGLLHYGPVGIGYSYADKVLSIYKANPGFCSGTAAYLINH